MTPPEIRLWVLLRGRPGGLKFRRQHPIGPYVADFYCVEKKLVIEVDGGVHALGDNPARDARRDDWLRSRGFAIIRIPAAEIRDNVEGVVAGILAA